MMLQLLKNITYLFCLLLIGSICACEEETDWDLEVGENGKLVVEAILVNENIIQEVKLSKSVDGLNDEKDFVNDATVTVNVGTFSYSFSRDTLEDGLYKSDFPFFLVANLEYRLNIVWEGELYHAGSYLTNVFPIPTIDFKPVGNSDSLLRFDANQYLYRFNQQAMYEMIIDWSALSDDEKTQAKIVFFTFSDVEVSEIATNTENVRFPKGSIVYLTKYGLNDDFADYLRAMAIETIWTGGLFYGASSSLPTNISNDGLGYFSTCKVLRDTFIAE